MVHLPLRAAPLGAFLKWRPLTRVSVPPLQPGEATVVSAQVRVPQVGPLGDFRRVLPSRLRAALVSDAKPKFARRPPNAPSPLTATDLLPPEPFALLGHQNQHWVGNIDVHCGRQAVERHVAKLRIYPGATNWAMFLVGRPEREDAYQCRLVLPDENWRGGLYECESCLPLICSFRSEKWSARPIDEQIWLDGKRAEIIWLRVEPPDGCRAGQALVYITQRSSQEQALVEFDLDPNAQGPGCFIL